MTETSYFWDGLVTGDASLAPYSANIWHTIWQIMYTRADNEGVLNNIDNQLAVSGIAGGVNVATGKALVDGTLYETDAIVNIVMANPSANPRIDRIVIKKDWLLQTIRIARVEGTENASPTAPALTQAAGSSWEIPLAQALITTAGVITLTDEREFARTRLSPVSNMLEIETIIGDGIASAITFDDIPTTFRHLLLTGSLSVNDALSIATNVYLNNDTNLANYNRQSLQNSNTSVISGGNSGNNPLLALRDIGADRDVSQRSVGVKLYFANYREETFYKTVMATEMAIPNDTTANFVISREGGLRKNTEAIHTINLISVGVFQPETILTLYGLS